MVIGETAMRHLGPFISWSQGGTSLSPVSSTEKHTTKSFQHLLTPLEGGGRYKEDTLFSSPLLFSVLSTVMPHVPNFHSLLIPPCMAANEIFPGTPLSHNTHPPWLQNNHVSDSLSCVTRRVLLSLCLPIKLQSLCAHLPCN